MTGRKEVNRRSRIHVDGPFGTKKLMTVLYGNRRGGGGVTRKLMSAWSEDGGGKVSKRREKQNITMLKDEDGNDTRKG